MMIIYLLYSRAVARIFQWGRGWGPGGFQSMNFVQCSVAGYNADPTKFLKANTRLAGWQLRLAAQVGRLPIVFSNVHCLPRSRFTFGKRVITFWTSRQWCTRSLLAPLAITIGDRHWSSLAPFEWRQWHH